MICVPRFTAIFIIIRCKSLKCPIPLCPHSDKFLYTVIQTFTEKATRNLEIFGLIRCRYSMYVICHQLIVITINRLCNLSYIVCNKKKIIYPDKNPHQAQSSTFNNYNCIVALFEFKPTLVQKILRINNINVLPLPILLLNGSEIWIL